MSISARIYFTYGTTFTLFIILFFFHPLSSIVCAAEKQSTPRPAKLFTSSEPISLVINAPWRDVKSKEKFQGAYPAKIEFTDELGNTASLNMTVERRGISRQVVCRFPPIKLRFDKKEVKGTSFRGQKSLKMVTHCQAGSRYEQYYILEMLAYQMYNIITDYSFKVQPLTVTYVDSKNGKKIGPKFAFLIEDDSDVAKRNGQNKLKIGRNKRNRLDARETGKFVLFQYMISNLDWSVISGPDKEECCHNVKLIGQDPVKGPVYAIPYDFDVTGLVNATYAQPSEKLPVSSVKQRLYRGFCIHNETTEDARQDFLHNKQAILALVRDEPLLSSGTRKKTLKYLERFFDILDDNREFQKKIIAKCRK